MIVREYKEADLDALLAMHRAQGFDYPFPDLRNPIFVSKLVVCENEKERRADSSLNGEGNCDAENRDGRENRVTQEEGRIVMAALARLTCEIYLLADPHSGMPRQRYTRLLELHRAGAADLRTRGLDDAHAWLPPRIAKRFGRRLQNLGWIRDDSWTPYCLRLSQ